MTSPPFFHEASGTVRFWVPIHGEEVGAMIGKETLHYCYQPTAIDDLPMDTSRFTRRNSMRPCVGASIPAPLCP